MSEKQVYTLAEIWGAFNELYQLVKHDGCDPDVDRFLIDDVATDVVNILTGRLLVTDGGAEFVEESDG